MKTGKMMIRVEKIEKDSEVQEIISTNIQDIIKLKMRELYKGEILIPH